MGHFNRFQQINGPAIGCSMANKEVIDSYQQKLPDSLLEFWKESGWCGYAEGLIWLVNPDEFKDILADWLDPLTPSAIVFARTAFGDMLVWDKGHVCLLDVLHYRVSELTSNLEVLFESALCRQEFRAKNLRGDIYKQALPRLGPVDHNECYMFVPALVLGGPGTPESLEKDKLREHLAILAMLRS